MKTFQKETKADFEKYINIIINNNCLKTERASFLFAIRKIAKDNNWENDLPETLKQKEGNSINELIIVW